MSGSKVQISTTYPILFIISGKLWHVTTVYCQPSIDGRQEFLLLIEYTTKYAHIFKSIKHLCGKSA